MVLVLITIQYTRKLRGCVSIKKPILRISLFHMDPTKHDIFSNVWQQDPLNHGQASLEAEAELTGPSEDLDEDRQHDQIQLQVPP